MRPRVCPDTKQVGDDAPIQPESGAIIHPARQLSPQFFESNSQFRRRRAPTTSMSNPNPLAPQGSMLEKHGRGRSTVQIISFIGAFHVFALCGLLWIGCKKDDQTAAGTNPDPSGNPGGLADPGFAANYDLPPLTNPPIGMGAYPAGSTPAGGAPAPYPDGPVADPLPPLGGGSLAPLPAGGLTAEPIPSGAVTEHAVISGDTGLSVARKYGVSFSALKAANPAVDWNRLKLKQVLVVPAPSAPTTGSTSGGTSVAGPAVDGSVSYTVKPGDTGTRIASKHGVTWKSIRSANGLKSDVIKPGQKLKIPAKAGAAGGGTTGGTPTAVPLPGR